MNKLIEKLLAGFHDSGTQADDAKYHLEVDFGTLIVIGITHNKGF